MSNKHKNDSRRSNIPANNTSKKGPVSKVNNGVFVYTRNMSVAELAKELNINSSDIIKFLFMNKKMVTINQTLDDETIGTVCLERHDWNMDHLVADMLCVNLHHAGQRFADPVYAKRLRRFVVRGHSIDQPAVSQFFDQHSSLRIFHMQLIAAVPLFRDCTGNSIGQSAQAVGGKVPFTFFE